MQLSSDVELMFDTANVWHHVLMELVAKGEIPVLIVNMTWLDLHQSLSREVIVSICGVS